MSDSPLRALVSVRSYSKPGEPVTIVARSQKAAFGKGWSFDIAEPCLTGAEQLLGLLATDILGLFLEICRKARVSVDEVEATGKAELLAPLSHLGVIGVVGEPRYDFFQIKAYIGSSAPSASLAALWQTTLSRAPLYNTLKLAAKIDVSFQIA